MRPDFESVRPLTTIEDRSGEFPVIAIGNEWSRRYFDGPFYVFEPPPEPPLFVLPPPPQATTNARVLENTRV